MEPNRDAAPVGADEADELDLARRVLEARDAVPLRSAGELHRVDLVEGRELRQHPALDDRPQHREDAPLEGRIHRR